MTDADVLVAGGGPAGAACAILLARAGRRVVLLERAAGPHEKVCGEFLGADAGACLATLGLDVAVLGGVPIMQAGIARGGTEACFALPFAAWGLSRRVLDEALLQAAGAAGVIVRRGVLVHAAARQGPAWRLLLDDGEALLAPDLVVATGKRPLRGVSRAGTGQGWVGAKLHLRLRVPLAPALLLPFAGGYAGLQPSQAGDANLCAALAPGRVGSLRDAAGFIALVRAGSPRAGALLEDARAAAPRPLTVAGINYGFVHRDTVGADPALWRLGDQFAVIPSFLGDGIAMALAGGIAAAAAMLSGQTAPAFHARWRRHVGVPMRIATLAGVVLRRTPGIFAGIIATMPGVARLVARATRIGGAGAPGGGGWPMASGRAWRPGGPSRQTAPE